MSQADPIADMLTRIRNANKALHSQAEMRLLLQKVELALCSRTRAISPGIQ